MGRFGWRVGWSMKQLVGGLVGGLVGLVEGLVVFLFDLLFVGNSSSTSSNDIGDCEFFFHKDQAVGNPSIG